MKYLTRKEFADVLSVKTEWTYKSKDFPKSCKRVPTGRGSPTMLWSQPVVDEFAKDFIDLDYDKVKSMNDSGVHRRKIAESLGVTAKAIGIFCRRNDIISLSTLANRRKDITIQGSLHLAELKHPFNVFLGRHFLATPSIR